MLLGNLIRIGSNDMSYWLYVQPAGAAGTGGILNGVYLEQDDSNLYVYSNTVGCQNIFRLSSSGAPEIGTVTNANNSFISDLKKINGILVASGSYSNTGMVMSFPNNDISNQPTVLFSTTVGVPINGIWQLSAGDYVGNTHQGVFRVSGGTKVWSAIGVTALCSVVDSEDNIFLASSYNSTVMRLHITKLDANGTVLWQKYVNNTGTTAIATSSSYRQKYTIDVDTFGNIFAVFRYATDARIGLLKISTDGVLLTQNSINVSAIASSPATIKVQGDYVYVTYTSTSNSRIICCFDLNCNLQWSRKVLIAGLGQGPTMCVLSTSSDALVVGFSQSMNASGTTTYCSSAIKLPLDGSLTGTYGKLNYTEEVITTVTQTHSLVDASIALSDTITISAGGSFGTTQNTGYTQPIV